MITSYAGERWKVVPLNIGKPTNNILEVSSFGRVRTFNKISDGNILKGSLINGYNIIRCKFYEERDAKTQKELIIQQKQIAKYVAEVISMKKYNESKIKIKDKITELNKLRKQLIKSTAADFKGRVINYHSLVHRLVATHFLKPPTNEQKIVGHKDYDKLNNRASNLFWMTQAECTEHQKNNPSVISELATRGGSMQTVKRNAKLTVTKVMLLKKLLNEGKSLKAMEKQFKVSGTQILRIQKGENWKDVPAAK